MTGTWYPFMYVTVEVQRYFETLAESGNKVPMTVPPGL